MKLLYRPLKSDDVFTGLIQSREASRQADLERLTQDIIDLQRAKLDGPMLGVHDRARHKAEGIYRSTLNGFLTVAEAEQLRKHKHEDLVALFLAMMLAASENAYKETARSLSSHHLATDGEARKFAKGRQQFLSDFAERVQDRISGVAAGAEFERIEREDANRLIETEAQITYGVAVDRLYKMAGYVSKRWQTQEDNRVRETHRACQKEGEVGIDGKFSNGLRYPGDPRGELSEIINCRCALLPGKKGAVQN